MSVRLAHSAQNLSTYHWAAVKGLNLRCYIGETLLNYLLYMPIMVTQFKFLNSNPDQSLCLGLLQGFISAVMTPSGPGGYRPASLGASHVRAPV